MFRFYARFHSESVFSLLVHSDSLWCYYLSLCYCSGSVARRLILSLHRFKANGDEEIKKLKNTKKNIIDLFSIPVILVYNFIV